MRGRGIAATDGVRSPRVLVVSETFAKRAFPGQDAIGRRIDWNDDTWEIAGVTVDVRHAALGDALDADVYVPRTQVVRGNTWLLIKTARPAGAVLTELQERMKAIDPNVALTDAETMPQRLAESTAPERFRAIVTGTLAGLTLLLAIVGLHGVVSYAVAQRTREIGVRLALGQRPAAVVRLVARRHAAHDRRGSRPWRPRLGVCRPLAVVGRRRARQPAGVTGRGAGDLRRRGARGCRRSRVAGKPCRSDRGLADVGARSRARTGGFDGNRVQV